MQYNLLFLGGGVIASKCLEHLKSENINIKGVVTSQAFYDQNNDYFGDAKYFSNETKDETELIPFIKSENIDLIISIQHPWILSENLINLVNGFAFNLHNAIIPDYKGHNTISHAIINGEKFYGTTIHWLAPKVDMGDIVFIAKTEIESNTTAFSLYQEMVDLSASNFEKFMDYLTTGKDLPRVKIEGKGKFYSKFGLDNFKKINDPSDLVELDRKSRAFYFPPHEPAFIEVGDKRHYVVPTYAKH